LLSGWEFQQTTTAHTRPHFGFENVFFWENGEGTHAEFAASLEGRLGGSWKRGQDAWGKRGVAVSQMSSLAVSLYEGNLFDNSTAVIVPKKPEYLPAIWAFCKSGDLQAEIRKYNYKTNVDNGYFEKIPFDISHWMARAKADGPLPAPDSDDPTQWLFKSHPKGSTDPLQVAVARLLGYRWPDQEPDDLDRLADGDGIVCIPAVRAEPTAADRLLELLRAAYGSDWSPSLLDTLLTASGCKPGTTLDDWLRNSFLEQHCKRFHNRPFIWHIWDGRRDGFSCLVNYHKLDHGRLESLT
jgi:hypothetical protein